MKKLAILFAFIVFSTMSFAQEEAHETTKEKAINFGLGYNEGFPIYFGMEWEMFRDISLGFAVSSNLNAFDWVRFNIKGDYYFDRIIGLPHNFDFYAGISAGVKTDFEKEKTSSGLDWDAHVGGRWYWNEKWALNLEVGGGYGFGGTFGLSMRL